MLRIESTCQAVLANSVLGPPLCLHDCVYALCLGQQFNSVWIHGAGGQEG